jgi:hypothetical protein
LVMLFTSIHSLSLKVNKICQPILKWNWLSLLTHFNRSMQYSNIPELCFQCEFPFGPLSSFISHIYMHINKYINIWLWSPVKNNFTLSVFFSFNFTNRKFAAPRFTQFIIIEINMMKVYTTSWLQATDWEPS